MYFKINTLDDFVQTFLSEKEHSELLNVIASILLISYFVGLDNQFTSKPYALEYFRTDEQTYNQV